MGSKSRISADEGKPEISSTFPLAKILSLRNNRHKSWYMHVLETFLTAWWRWPFASIGLASLNRGPEKNLDPFGLKSRRTAHEAVEGSLAEMFAVVVH